MMDRRVGLPKGSIVGVVERIVLSAAMSFLVFVVERQLSRRMGRHEKLA